MLILNRITEFLILTHISSRSNLILCSHLRLGIPNVLFPVDLSVNILKASLPSYILAACPAYLNLMYLIALTMLGEWYELLSSSLWSLLHSPFSSLLGLNFRVRFLCDVSEQICFL